MTWALCVKAGTVRESGQPSCGKLTGLAWVRSTHSELLDCLSISIDSAAEGDFGFDIADPPL